MVKCKDCKWWEEGEANPFYPVPRGCCKLAETEFNSVPIHPESLATACSYEEANLVTLPEFGCVQGEPK